MVRRIIFFPIVGAGLFAACSSPAQASNVQTTMAVTATNVNSCAVVALPLAFGPLNQVSATASDSQTTLTVTCTPGVAYTVGLDAGAHATGGVRQMQVVAGTATIPYFVYSDATRTTTWGNAIGTDTVARTATVTPTLLTVYGRIPGNAPMVQSGAYADLVTVTVTF